MIERPYAIGVDFGTESGRVLVLDTRTGEELAVAAVPYPSGVIDQALPSGAPLGDDWALQDPDDWLTVLESGIPGGLCRGRASPVTRSPASEST